MTGPDAGLRNVQVSLVDRGLARVGLSAPTPSTGADPRAQVEGVSLECGVGRPSRLSRWATGSDFSLPHLGRDLRCPMNRVGAKAVRRLVSGPQDSAHP